MYNTAFRYSCARARSAGLFELPHFNDLVKAVLSVFYCLPYTDYTKEKKIRVRSKYKVKQCRQNAPDMVRRNSQQKWQDAPQGESVDLPGRKSAKYFLVAVDILVYSGGYFQAQHENFSTILKILQIPRDVLKTNV